MGGYIAKALDRSPSHPGRVLGQPVAKNRAEAAAQQRALPVPRATGHTLTILGACPSLCTQVYSERQGRTSWPTERKVKEDGEGNSSPAHLLTSPDLLGSSLEVLAISESAQHPDPGGRDGWPGD